MQGDLRITGILVPLLALIVACTPAARQDNATSDQSAKPASHEKEASAPSVTHPVHASTPPPLSRYVGKYPWDKVDGVDFLHHPAVIKAIDNAVVDSKTRALLLSNDGTTGPIIRSRGRLYMRYYDPKSGGSVNWALLVSEDGTKSAVCVTEGDPVQDVSGATWYSERREAFVLYERCPYEAEDLESMTADWPIGPIPS